MAGIISNSVEQRIQSSRQAFKAEMVSATLLFLFGFVLLSAAYDYSKTANTTSNDKNKTTLGKGDNITTNSTATFVTSTTFGSSNGTNSTMPAGKPNNMTDSVDKIKTSEEESTSSNY